uniref:C2H2-type domain-containing protein n=1 Tax=Scophthalmus maximus TaxID=52904 RepID=A0A8D3C9E0_SCOMX
MNGAVYISFFQGQLESVLEQVVQLAVQEISRTVGCSLNALLLETAAKEQENRRLRLQLQRPAAEGGGTEPELPRTHAPGGQRAEPRCPTDTRRLEQRGRVVDQLKSVMEQVLNFAVRELTKIVEASFDDLLLEITKMDREQQVLEEGLGGKERRVEEEEEEEEGRREEEEEERREEEEEEEEEERRRPPVLSVSQDWFPILDKVFGQKWCSDVWQIKELAEGGGGGGRGLIEGGAVQVEPRPFPSLTLEPAPSSPQQDPRSSGRRSSASMLHRLLTLPSQLLEEDDEGAGTKESRATLANDGANDCQDGVEPPGRTCPSSLTTREEEEEEEEEEYEEEDKGRKKKRRRVWSECDECGRRFSRMSLLKAHRQTHVDASSPPDGAASALRCSDCGKRFSSATRLHSHIRTQHPGNRA